jgi:hypothetical protein
MVVTRQVSKAGHAKSVAFSQVVLAEQTAFPGDKRALGLAGTLGFACQGHGLCCVQNLPGECRITQTLCGQA